MESALILGLVGAAAVAVVVVLALRAERGRAETMAQMQVLAQTAEKLTTSQEILADRQQQTQGVLNERLEAISKRLGDGLNEQTEKTGETLKTLHERLAVIDVAQKNLTDLSQEMVSLQDILSNKQTRGAFGQIQLESLVRDALPATAYGFEVTLSNGKRVDCLVRLPNPPGPVAIDSKFPLEGYRALADARDEAAQKQAARQFSADVRKHVHDISERYVLPGETADWAMMFLPSEAVYAEIHANFPNVVEEAHKRRVAVVSPSTLMAVLTTVRAIFKDARMREQTAFIQEEVGKMLTDVGRLDDRVGNLQKHFNLAEKDLREIRTSADKITRKGEKIIEAPVADEAPGDDLAPPSPRIEQAN